MVPYKYATIRNSYETGGTVRLAVISDVHGNAFALEAVLAEVRREAPDLTVNLGDQVSGRADPARAFLLQRQLGAVEVLGSAETRLLDTDAFHGWLRAQLPGAAVTHLRQLPLTARVAGGEVVACHGSLTDPHGHLLWSWQRGPYLARAAWEVRAEIAPLQARVVLCGHTHREMCTALDDTLLVNVGAVSLQVDGDRRARWALLERRARRWEASFRRVSYDWAAAARWALEHAPEAREEASILETGGA